MHQTMQKRRKSELCLKCILVSGANTITIAVLHRMLHIPQLTRACTKGWITSKGGNVVWFLHLEGLMISWEAEWSQTIQTALPFPGMCYSSLKEPWTFSSPYHNPQCPNDMVKILMLWWIKIPCTIYMFFPWALRCWVESLTLWSMGRWNLSSAQ